MNGPDKILERITAALKAVTVADFALSVLQTEKAERFIQIMQVETPIMREARRLPMNAPTRDIDLIEMAGAVLNLPANLEANDTNDQTIQTVTNQLVAKELMGATGLKDASLEENIERGNFEDTLLDMLGERAGIDLENVFLNGDDAGATSTALDILDGWMLDAGNAVAGPADFAVGDVEAMFEALLTAVPSKYFRNLAQWAFYVPWVTANAYVNVLKNRGTPVGDQALVSGAEAPRYKGVRVVVVQNMLAGKALFVNPDNLVWGVLRDVRVETERFPRKRQTDFILTMRADCDYENREAAAVATGFVAP